METAAMREDGMIVGKRRTGQFYTVGNPFFHQAFRKWAEKSGAAAQTILEPFAGSNRIIRHLEYLGLAEKSVSYDLHPAAGRVKKRDTIADFPGGISICITNPPWLAKNSATRLGLPYPSTPYDNLYKHCLGLCLEHCQHVAALLPASFLQSGLFRERLTDFILLDNGIFEDTDNPVCLSLFGEGASQDVNVYREDQLLGSLQALESLLPKSKNMRRLRFNDPDGPLGFISFDNTRTPSIRFCAAEEILEYEIKESSRFITRISGELGRLDTIIQFLNARIDDFREQTKDVFLTPFKGMRNDGMYRRRMNFALARAFIDEA